LTIKQIVDTLYTTPKIIRVFKLFVILRQLSLLHTWENAIHFHVWARSILA